MLRFMFCNPKINNQQATNNIFSALLSLSYCVPNQKLCLVASCLGYIYIYICIPYNFNNLSFIYIYIKNLFDNGTLVAFSCHFCRQKFHQTQSLNSQQKCTINYTCQQNRVSSSNATTNHIGSHIHITCMSILFDLFYGFIVFVIVTKAALNFTFSFGGEILMAQNVLFLYLFFVFFFSGKKSFDRLAHTLAQGYAHTHTHTHTHTQART